MVINNFSFIQDLLDFSNPDYFYFAQVIQRKKDFPLNTFSKNYRAVKSFYIFSESDLETKFSTIQNLCVSLNARAYLWLNRRSYKTIVLESIGELARSLENENFHKGCKIWDSCCGKNKISKDKFWFVDIDTKDSETLSYWYTLLGKYLIVTIPTISGYHLICQAFPCTNIQDTSIIKKDSPILLYYEHNNSNKGYDGNID